MSAGNPEDDVLHAIEGLEHDETGDIVRWQLEEGVRRGDGPAHSLGEEIMADFLSETPDVFAERMRQLGFTRAERREAFVGEVYTPGADNSNPETIRIVRGDRVGWQGLDGVLHSVVVDDFTVSPSGEWTFTARPDDDPAVRLPSE